MNFEQARSNMIEQQIRTWEVLDQRVLDLLASVPREDFVPPRYRSLAFSDTNIPLGFGEVMMAPKVEARMLQVLAIEPDDRILEIGTGSGYVTALLARSGREVTTVEIHHYHEIKLLVSLDHPEARSWDLYPKDINTEQDVEKKKSFGLSADLKFTPVGAFGASAEFGATFHYKNLRPIISAFGEGSTVFRWEYRRQPSQSILPGTRFGYAVLQVPRGLRYLAGKIEYEAILEYNLLKLLLKNFASTGYEPFKLGLPAMSSNEKIRLPDFTQPEID